MCSEQSFDNHDSFYVPSLAMVQLTWDTTDALLTSNRPFRKWHAMFDVDNTLAASLMVLPATSRAGRWR